MSIVTLPQVKRQLGIRGDASNDELQAYVDGITSVVEDYKREVIARRTVTERLRLCGGVRFRLWKTPVLSLTSVTSLDGSRSWDVSGFESDRETGLVDVVSGPGPVGLVHAVYEAGYDGDDFDFPVPENYVRGALVIIQHTWETQRGAVKGVTGAVGPEESRDVRYMFTFPRKAREWLGAPRPVVG